MIDFHIRTVCYSRRAKMDKSLKIKSLRIISKIKSVKKFYTSRKKSLHFTTGRSEWRDLPILSPGDNLDGKRLINHIIAGDIRIEMLLIEETDQAVTLENHGRVSRVILGYLIRS